GAAEIRAAPHVARRRTHPRPRRRQAIRSDAVPPDARRRGSARDALAGGVVGARLMARKTSFYYAFLVLPPPQRRAIVAVWDFCRAVDDAVDEAPSGGGLPHGREAVPFWRDELARAFEGRSPV